MIQAKRLLRFYFNSDGLEAALNNLILNTAYRSADVTKGGEFYAERIIALVEAKKRLGELWQYIDGVISSMNGNEIQTLKRYALMRSGIGKLNDGERREIKRSTIKFTRHMRSLERFKEGVRLVSEYYCLI